MKVIDFRFRPNTPEIINGISHSAMFKRTCERINFKERKPESLDAIVDNLDRLGIELAVITGRDAETTYGSPSNNQEVLKFCQARPDKFKGFWGIDPHKKMAAVAEIEDAVKNKGMSGVSLDPYLAHLPPSEARFYPIYSKCCELSVPVIITMAPPMDVPGAVLEYSRPADVDKVARDFPDLVIVMSHGGYPYAGEAVYTCLRNRNVYMDISEYERAPMVNIYIEGIKSMIPDKVLFASAHPFVEVSEALSAYKDFDLPPEILERVMHGNAERVLGLAG